MIICLVVEIVISRETILISKAQSHIWLIEFYTSRGTVSWTLVMLHLLLIEEFKKHFFHEVLKLLLLTRGATALSVITHFGLSGLLLSLIVRVLLVLGAVSTSLTQREGASVLLVVELSGLSDVAI